MKFFLPARIPQFDFQFQLLASQDYWTNFKKSPLEIEYANDYINWEAALRYGKWKDYCPVGSIEFCNECGIKTLPRNIPPQLKDYACGRVVTKKEDLSKELSKYWHVKSSKQIKHKDNGKYLAKNIPFEDDEFQAVEWLEEGFVSEWRVFVLDGNIIDMQNYAGDIWTLPNKSVVEDMIYDFERARYANIPPAYTLDVGVSKAKDFTYVIEVHDFYACGTYNLNDHYRYPIMLWEWWNWYRRSIHNT